MTNQLSSHISSPFFGKILEALVNKQLTSYIEINNLLDPSQSGFRAYHSTVTALLETVDNIRLSLDARQSAILVLLDLSAAFDTISHCILLDRLRDLGVGGAALAWFRSYLADRAAKVQLGAFTSGSQRIDKGVPQGSILSPTLFNMHVAPLANVIKSHGFDALSYADDTQMLITCGPNPEDTKERFKQCMLDIQRWMSNNHLQLNTSKTEIILFGNVQSLWSPDWWPPTLGPCPSPKSSVRNLGVLIDDKLSMSDHINNIARVCYGLMRSFGKS